MPCARRVVEDWYDNSRVDRIYAIPCYTEALKLLPDFGFGPDPTARDEIQRALQYAGGGKGGNAVPRTPEPDRPPSLASAGEAATASVRSALATRAYIHIAAGTSGTSAISASATTV